jgi:Ni,Fe-hydrogenase I cytochrome b subunit
MSSATKLMAGLTLFLVPIIQYGGYFLLTLLFDKRSGYMVNALRQNLFRAGHAHAGVIIILSLVCQILVDASDLPKFFQWMVRIGVPVAAMLLSSGFFLSVLSSTSTGPNRAVNLIYCGSLILTVSAVTLGIGLLRAR